MRFPSTLRQVDENHLSQWVFLKLLGKQRVSLDSRSPPWMFPVWGRGESLRQRASVVDMSHWGRSWELQFYHAVSWSAKAWEQERLGDPPSLMGTGRPAFPATLGCSSHTVNQTASVKCSVGVQDLRASLLATPRSITSDQRTCSHLRKYSRNHEGCWGGVILS